MCSQSPTLPCANARGLGSRRKVARVFVHVITDGRDTVQLKGIPGEWRLYAVKR